MVFFLFYFLGLFLFCFKQFKQYYAEITANEVATVSCHLNLLILNVLESTGNFFITDSVALSLNKKEFVCNTWRRLGRDCVSKGVFCPVALV